MDNETPLIADVIELGELLFGDAWIPRLAGRLRVSDSLIRKVVSGRRGISPSLHEGLANVVADELAAIGEREEKLRRLATCFGVDHSNN